MIDKTKQINELPCSGPGFWPDTGIHGQRPKVLRRPLHIDLNQQTLQLRPLLPRPQLKAHRLAHIIELHQLKVRQSGRGELGFERGAPHRLRELAGADWVHGQDSEHVVALRLQTLDLDLFDRLVES